MLKMRYQISLQNLVTNNGRMVYDMNKRFWPYWSENVELPILERVRTGNIYATTIDPIIENFETEFSRLCCPGMKTIFCNSGTSGLLAAYFGLNLDPGAEVLVPTNTFRATVTPMLILGLTPVFCDCHYSTGLINFEDLEKRITPRTQAIVVTHIWGHPENMDIVIDIAKKYDLAVVEDCSHAHGAKWDNRNVGTFGDVSVFSLGTKKMISGGLAGAVVTRDQRIFERAVLLCQPKPWADSKIITDAVRKYTSSGLGFNLRGSPISAILTTDHLYRLERTIQFKNNNLNQLSKLIEKYLPHMIPPQRHDKFTYGTWYSYKCRWEHPTIKRDRVIELLLAAGLSVEKPSGLLHKKPIFTQADQFFPGSKAQPAVEGEYVESELLMENLIDWETRNLYEPADEILDQYIIALEKVSAEIYG